MLCLVEYSTTPVRKFRRGKGEKLILSRVSLSFDQRIPVRCGGPLIVILRSFSKIEIFIFLEKPLFIVWSFLGPAAVPPTRREPVLLFQIEISSRCILKSTKALNRGRAIILLSGSFTGVPVVPGAVRELGLFLILAVFKSFEKFSGLQNLKLAVVSLRNFWSLCMKCAIQSAIIM